MSSRRVPVLLRPALVLLGLGALAPPSSAQLQNGSFEEGTFEPWTTTDLGFPLVDLQVSIAGLENGETPLTSEPTDGDFSAVTGFEGDGPGTITLAQDVNVPLKESLLLFDFSTEWDLATDGISTLDRTCSVLVEPAGGGSTLFSAEIVRIVSLSAGSLLHVTAAVSLADFAGQTVNLKFLWDVPEEFTGPALFDLDHVRFVGKKVPAADAASLKIKLDFQQQAKDTIKLVTNVFVGEEYEPDGDIVTVTVADHEEDFDLDAAGHSVTEAGSLKVSPDPNDPKRRKLTMVLKGGNFLEEMASAGLTNMDTPKAGITTLVPVFVSIGGEDTSREILVVYKASHEGVGKATGKVRSEFLPTKLDVKLDFAASDADSLTLKTSARVSPGLVITGQVIDVAIGAFSTQLTLDVDGDASAGSTSISTQRDPKNPGRQAIVLKCKDLDLQELLAADGLVEDDIPKPGQALLLPVTLSLGGLVTRIIVPVTYTAEASVSGHAVGKL